MTKNSDKFEVLKFNELSARDAESCTIIFGSMSTGRTVRNFSDRSVPKEIGRASLGDTEVPNEPIASHGISAVAGTTKSNEEFVSERRGGA